MSDDSSNDKKGKGFAGLDSMVSDVTEDVTRAAAASPPPLSLPQTQSKPAASPAYGSHPSNFGKPGMGGIGWLIAGVIGLAVLIFNSGDRNSPPAAYDAPASFSAPATESQAPTPSEALPVASSTAGVEKPPVGRDEVLGAPQIRYCITERIRIDAVESVINNAYDHEVDRFNALVNDYNSRCGEFRYRGDDVERVRRELNPASAAITSAARSEWVRSSLGLNTPSQPPADLPSTQQQTGNKEAQPQIAMPVPSQTISAASADSLSPEERQSIQSACSTEKTLYGPAAYNSCVSEKLAALRSAPRNIDLSSLSREERQSLQSACSTEKTLYGPAAYNSCVSEKLAALRSAPRNIDLSSLSREERQSLQSACSTEKTLYGPAAYNSCVSEKLTALRSGPRNINLSGLSHEERRSLQSACSTEKILYGPAAYNNCLTQKLR